jgi:hypothetical protein
MAARLGSKNRGAIPMDGRRMIPGCPILLAAGANGGQALSDARIQADNGGGDLIHSGNQSQTDRGYDERVLHQILPLFVPNESDQEFLHNDDSLTFSRLYPRLYLRLWPRLYPKVPRRLAARTCARKFSPITTRAA